MLYMTNERYESARKIYQSIGVDTEAALDRLKNVPVSMHCWQGDDVIGFDSRESLSGGIQTTGNYPGRAATPEQLMQDISKVLTLVPGKKKLNLHASYAIIDDGSDRDSIKPKHFTRWVEFAKKYNMGIDFNPTFFSHRMVKDGLTLSSPDEEVRKFWIEHGKRCIEISEYFANETGQPCVMNIWIPDGYKDIPADRLGPRRRFKESLDEILSIPYDKSKVFVCLESKVFGIGVESYTVGSSEFCMNYVARAGITPLMDNGHYHPTEVVSDKVSSMLLFNDHLALHITRPGKKKLNLHASYAIIDDGSDRDSIKPKHFTRWVEFAKKYNMGIDFNPTFFSHRMVKDGLTLSSPDEEVRKFWIEHGKRCIEISEYFANETGQPCVMNIWIPDGYKDIPADRLGPRRRFKESLDEILSIPYDKSKVFVCLESKVFGIGVESYTVGSSEFCMNYVARAGITPLMDNGHYHPTEVVSDKVSSMLLFNDHLALHITRPVRWDSDHVVLYDDETREIAKEIVRADALDKVFIATDYFDASINRISAWITGMRSVQKALLYALLEPESLRNLQNEGRFTELMAAQEELKIMPFGDIWQEYLNRENVAADYVSEVMDYEKKVLEAR